MIKEINDINEEIKKLKGKEIFYIIDKNSKVYKLKEKHKKEIEDFESNFMSKEMKELNIELHEKNLKLNVLLAKLLSNNIINCKLTNIKINKFYEEVDDSGCDIESVKEFADINSFICDLERIYEKHKNSIDYGSIMDISELVNYNYFNNEKIEVYPSKNSVDNVLGKFESLNFNISFDIKTNSFSVCIDDILKYYKDGLFGEYNVVLNYRYELKED